MKHEKIIKRKDGSRVRVSVEILLPEYHWRPNVEYNVFIETCEPKKRKFINFFHVYDKTYNVVSYLITKEEIQQVKMELWEKLKPVE